jgi:DNA processing protein
VSIEAAVQQDDLDFWIALTRVSGIGPRRFDLLIQSFGSARDVWEADAARLAAAGLDRRSVESIVATRRKVDPSQEQRNLRAMGGVAIPRRDDRYPASLAEIYDPPPVLYVKGELDAPYTPAVAIVGTRGATSYGRWQQNNWRAV